MKKPTTAAKATASASASDHIDACIKKLGDWRGEILAHRPDVCARE